MSIASITRIVRFIRMGERGNSVITAVTPIRRFTLAQWQQYASNNFSYGWANISNAADFKKGDTMVINGVATDKGDISVIYYGKVVSVTAANNTVTTLGQTIIVSGTNGSSFMAQYSKDGSTNWHDAFTDGDIYMRTSADSGKTWSNAIRIVGEKGDETNYQFAWSGHKTLEDSEDPLSDVVDWYDYPPKQPDGKPYLWVMITTPDNKVSYARLTGEKGDKGERGAVMRGPQAWSDCAVGYVFQSGANGEEFKDVVMYGNNYYSCVKSHAKTAANYPTSTTDTNNGYWKLADKFEMVATKILLAQYALVKNLGVEAIDMKDSAGNIIFQAKDGNVICNSGTFNNVNVRGNLLSRNDTTMNEIEVNADEGYIKMRGPNLVREDTDLPDKDAKLKDLFEVRFGTDPDTLSRYAYMRLYGSSSTTTIDPDDGISWTDFGGTTHYKRWEEIFGV